MFYKLCSCVILALELCLLARKSSLSTACFLYGKSSHPCFPKVLGLCFGNLCIQPSFHFQRCSRGERAHSKVSAWKHRVLGLTPLQISCSFEFTSCRASWKPFTHTLQSWKSVCIASSRKIRGSVGICAAILAPVASAAFLFGSCTLRVASAFLCVQFRPASQGLQVFGKA